MSTSPHASPTGSRHRGPITAGPTPRAAITLIRSYWRSKPLAALVFIVTLVAIAVVNLQFKVDITFAVALLCLLGTYVGMLVGIVAIAIPLLHLMMPNYRWWELRTPDGHAVIGGHAKQKGFELGMFGAAPRGRKLKLGEELGEHVLYQLRSEGYLVTAEAIPALVARYQGFGLVPTGKSGVLWLTRKLVDEYGPGQPKQPPTPPLPARCT